MTFSNLDNKKLNNRQDFEIKCLKKMFLPLIAKNNVTKNLFTREIGGYSQHSYNICNVNYKYPYNFKVRRFIIYGNDCFTQMWKVVDTIWELLCNRRQLQDKKDFFEKRSKSLRNLMIYNKNIKLIRRHFESYNIKDQVHIIEKNQPLDNEDIDRINRCFMLIIIDYSNDFSTNIRGNIEYIQERHNIMSQNVRINNIISEERNWLGQTRDLPYQDKVIPEILKIYNSEKKEEVSVVHTNICYVSTNKVLHHNSWINISEYE